MTKVLALLTVFAELFVLGCGQSQRPLARYMEADHELAIAYTSTVPGVAESALRKHRGFLSREVDRYGPSNYQIAYAYATERLARECEKRGAVEDARALRAELAAFVSSIDRGARGPITTAEVARAVSQIDMAIGKRR